MKAADHIIEGRPSFEDLVERFSDAFPLLLQLSETPQDPEWHAEGDVATHTEMVLERTYDECEQRGIKGEARVLLALAALLHDVAKPITTRSDVREGVERIIAPGHPDAGAVRIMWNGASAGLALGLRRRLAALVLHHQRPKWFSKDGREERHWRRLARSVDVSLLEVLALADMKGRECPDRQEQIDWVRLFGMQAEEWGLDNPYEGWRRFLLERVQEEGVDTSDAWAFSEAIRLYETGSIQSQWEAGGLVHEWESDKSDVVILMGPSGSGKSTWRRRHLSAWDVVSPDQIREEFTGDASDQSENGRVRQEAQERLRVSLRAQKRVVWDATNLRRDFRSRVVRLALDYGARTTLVCFLTPQSVAIRRNVDRTRTVPSGVVLRQYSSIQMPKADEAHNVVWIDGGEHVVDGVDGNLPVSVRDALAAAP